MNSKISSIITALSITSIVALLALFMVYQQKSNQVQTTTKETPSQALSQNEPSEVPEIFVQGSEGRACEYSFIVEETYTGQCDDLTPETTAVRPGQTINYTLTGSTNHPDHITSARYGVRVNEDDLISTGSATLDSHDGETSTYTFTYTVPNDAENGEQIILQGVVCNYALDPACMGGTQCRSTITVNDTHAADCDVIKIFDADGNRVTDPSTLLPGQGIQLVVIGSISDGDGTFTQATFTVNGETFVSTTNWNNNLEAFYIDYTVPDDVRSTGFSASATLTHTDLGEVSNASACSTSGTGTKLVCYDQTCYSDDDCNGDLVCADNGYCSEPNLETNCNTNPSEQSCCGQLSCYEETCTTDDDCAGDLVCADNGYCSDENLKESCEANPSQQACCGQLSCYEETCTTDDDCAGDLVCANNGYCAESDLKESCEANPSQQACCGQLSCGDESCVTDSDCEGSLVCVTDDNDADKKYCANSSYQSACEDNPSYENCCEEQPLECANEGCDNNDDCSGDLICITADNGSKYCAKDEYSGDACKQHHDYDTCCQEPPPAIPELPRAGGVPPTIIFTLGGIVLVALGLLF